MSDREKVVKKKELFLLLSVILFLLFAYFSAEIVWLKDIILLVDLISAMIAIFVGILALVRFYTNKSRLTFLLLGLGFLAIGVFEVVNIISLTEGFFSLLSYTPGKIYPLSMILSNIFLALVIFFSWFVRKDYQKGNTVKERIVFLSIFFLFLLVLGFFAFFTELLSGYQEYVPALVGGILSMLLYVLSILGYVRSNSWKYESFDYWLIFSIVFILISTFFFVPLFNLEYDLALKFSTFAKLFSYIFLLIGFLVSIYEMFNREMEYLEELKSKNEQLLLAKNKVEEAYMVLRNEKLELKKNED
jgi:hypothetical protein